jgi:hypothetical protein
MGTLIRNVLNLNDIDAVDVVSTAAADTTLLIDDFNHGQSNLIWEFVRCAKTTVCLLLRFHFILKQSVLFERPKS